MRCTWVCVVCALWGAIHAVWCVRGVRGQGWLCVWWGPGSGAKWAEDTVWRWTCPNSSHSTAWKAPSDPGSVACKLILTVDSRSGTAQVEGEVGAPGCASQQPPPRPGPEAPHGDPRAEALSFLRVRAPRPGLPFSSPAGAGASFGPQESLQRGRRSGQDTRCCEGEASRTPSPASRRHHIAPRGASALEEVPGNSRLEATEQEAAPPQSQSVPEVAAHPTPAPRHLPL